MNASATPKRLFDHIERIKSHVVRDPAGLLPYRYIIPTALQGDAAHRQTGVYAQQYDWDAFFEGVALTYDGSDGAEAFRDAMCNFLHFTTSAGYTPRTLSPEKFWDFPDRMKPFLAQGCLLASRALDDASWLRGERYRRLAATLEYWDANRVGGHGLYMWRSALESGVDNNASSVNRPDFSVEAVDVNAYLVRELRAASRVAELLGFDDDAERFAARAIETTRRMNAVLWDEQDGIYYDVLSVSDEPIARIKVKTWTCLTALWAGVPTSERARRLVDAHVLDEATYWGEFGVPSLARSEPVYNQGRRGIVYIPAEERRWTVSNWQGPVWFIANWQVMHGLMSYGYAREARDLADRITALLDRDVGVTGGMHENYDAETGAGLWSPNFGSWNLLAAYMASEAESGFDPARI